MRSIPSNQGLPGHGGWQEGSTWRRRSSEKADERCAGEKDGVAARLRPGRLRGSKRKPVGRA